MSERPKNGADRRSKLGSGPVDALASRVLSVVANRADAARSQFHTDLLDDLVQAVQDINSDAPQTVVDAMFDAGISAEDIIDRYIPAAARILGDQWCEDELGFADVTIGSSRLQAMLRDLETPVIPALDAPAVIAVVAKDSYHTLGAMVVASQLRRLGLAVTTAIGRSPQELLDQMEHADFDLVLISASGSERLDSIRKLVNSLRKGMKRVVPIVLGGGIISQHDNVKTLTGADYITNDPKEALDLCGLTIPMPGGVPSEPQD